MIYVPPEPVVILGAARTPQGSLDGCVAQFTAARLGGFAVAGALERARVAPDRADECIMGNVVSAGLLQAPAKQAGVAAGIPPNKLFKTVNTVCASGMTALFDGCLSLAAGVAEIVVAGGMESRSNAPYYLGPRGADGQRLPGKLRGMDFRLRTPGRNASAAELREFINAFASAPLREASILDSLACPFCHGRLMRDYAVAYAERNGISIDAINAAAGESYRKARSARDSGAFAREIVPAGNIASDDIISEQTEADYRALAYEHVATYNAPQLGDGAAALVIALAKTAERMELCPVARVVAFSRIDTPPEGFVHAPVDAVLELRRATGKMASIVEANESFGVQIPVFQREFGADVVNPYGGAVALAHPVAASGARVVVTLINAMNELGHEHGAATICFGSGGAMAVAVDLV